MNRWIRVLLIAVVVDVAMTLVFRFEDLSRLVHGNTSFSSVVGVIGLAWLVVVIVAVGGVDKAMSSARRRLELEEQALAELAGTSEEWLWRSDAELRLTYCSERVTDQLGYKPAELLGRSMPSLLAPEDEKRAWHILADALRDRSGWSHVEMKWRHADGHLVLLQGSAVPIFDDSGTLVGFRGTRRQAPEASVAERALVAARQRMSEVLSSQALDVALQPIVGMATGRLVGAEALARFRDGRGPDVWFAEAHDTGQALALDRLTFLSALETLAALPDRTYLSINATPELLTDPHLLEWLTSGRVPLERLVVEITEHIEIGRYDQILAGLLPLRERGLRLAVDDTGAGYASFRHVLQLRPDIIKIDRSLVGNIAHDAARRSLVTALVLLALELDAGVTGEGVETKAELDALAILGADNAQGYLLGRPTVDTRRWRGWHQRTWHQVDRPSAHPWRSLQSDRLRQRAIRRVTSD